MGAPALRYEGRREYGETGGVRMRRPWGWWGRKSTPAKVETYTRWSFHFFAVAEFMAVGLPLVGGLRTGTGWWLPAMTVAHCVLSAVTASRALDWTRGRRPQPVRLLWTLAAATAVVAVTAIGIAEHGPDREGVDTAAGGVFGVVLVFGAASPRSACADDDGCSRSSPASRWAPGWWRSRSDCPVRPLWRR